jgi:transcription elongation factor GreA
MRRTPITKQGLLNLQEELKDLKTHQRPGIIRSIAEAREHGDLKENAEYHAAKEKQGMVEARIKMLENLQVDAQVIDLGSLPQDGKITFGSKVTLENLDTNEVLNYQIVGEYEADIRNKKISINSPISRAIIGKMLDDEVSVQTPSGQQCYLIKSVKYA